MIDLARSPKQLGGIIRNARKSHHLSQSELAIRAGLRQEMISLVENGRAVRLSTIFSVLAALDLELHVTARSTNHWENEP